MMWPRLQLLQELLADDGVIFVSIDDNEHHHLRMLMDEVFGPDQFLVEIVWRKRSTPPNDKVIGADHDIVLVYCRDTGSVALNLRSRSEQQVLRYQNPDDHPKGPWVAGDLMANVKGGRFVASLAFPITNPVTGQVHYPGQNGNWRFSQDTIQQLLANDEIWFGTNGKGRPKLKRFLNDVKEGVTYPSIWDFVPMNTVGSQEMQLIFGDSTAFESPKPEGLLREIVRLGAGPDSIILDSFAGSGTTAHAVLALNKEDGGNRRFILVECEDYADSITAERVRRVINGVPDAKDAALREGLGGLVHLLHAGRTHRDGRDAHGRRASRVCVARGVPALHGVRPLGGRRRADVAERRRPVPRDGEDRLLPDLPAQRRLAAQQRGRC